MGLSATELRIGNYHLYHIVDKLDERGEYYEICKIDADDFRILENFDCPEYKPIPLTEEWLLKFGFDIFPWGWVKKSNSDFGIRLNLRSFSYDLEGNNPVQLKYVHQLQNLYFALTGEELTIK